MITNVAFDFSFSSFVSNSLHVGWFVTLNIFILMMQEDQEDLVQGVGKAESLPSSLSLAGPKAPLIEETYSL